MREKGDMAILRIRKDVTLLKEKWNMAIIFPHKADKCHPDLSVNFKQEHSGFESQEVFQPKLRPHVTSIVS